MTATKQVIDAILAMPTAPNVVEELNAVLEEERKRRNQFYKEITEFEKAEFINGEVVIHSPVKKMHNDATGELYQLIKAYVKKRKSGAVGIEKIMISLTRNDYEPDLCFFGEQKAKDFKRDQMFFPAPDLIVEVLSSSTADNDRGVKFNDYEAHGVTEYWIINADKEVVEQYRLNDEQAYELILKASTGTIECLPLEGFGIDIRAIFDEEINLKELNRILNM
ncbi:MAG: Uma2 family endonuclease [Bacteroidota bacterium]